jgi:hypothetical protein
MKKDSLMCFRLSKSMRDSLAKLAREEKRSLSSMIEIVLFNYLKEKKALKGIKKDKRQYPRKNVSVPAFINQNISGEKKLHAGSVTNLSLGGVHISIPQDIPGEVIFDPEKSKFEIIFTLPGENRPIRLTCESRRVVDSKEALNVGASFVDADFNSYKALNTYLM